MQSFCFVFSNWFTQKLTPKMDNTNVWCAKVWLPCTLWFENWIMKTFDAWRLSTRESHHTAVGVWRCRPCIFSALPDAWVNPYDSIWHLRKQNFLCILLRPRYQFKLRRKISQAGKGRQSTFFEDDKRHNKFATILVNCGERINRLTTNQHVWHITKKIGSHYEFGSNECKKLRRNLCQ